MIIFLVSVAIYLVLGMLLTLYCITKDTGYSELNGTNSTDRLFIFALITVGWIVMLPIAIWKN